jgi:hypothetical protein
MEKELFRAKSQRRGGKSGVVNFPVKKTLRLCARLMADEFAFDLYLQPHLAPEMIKPLENTSIFFHEVE